MKESKKIRTFNGRQMLIWLAALILGGVLGMLGNSAINDLFNFIASAYTRLFKFVAVPTIALAVTTTLAMLGAKRDTGKIFLHTIIYTLLTTLVAAIVGAILYLAIAPGNLPLEMVKQAQSSANADLPPMTVYSHILAVIPDNILAPFSSGNVLSILLVAAAIGLALAAGKHSENIQILIKAVNGLQEIFFIIIKALIAALPLGIVAFAGQLTSQMATGESIGGLGKYVAVVLGGNVLQFFVILPIFLLLKKLNPVKVFKAMLPAVLMALFTKSSAATLPVTVASAENNLKAKPEVARFILPLCCTINMNGCAAFIMVTSLFVMQNGGITLTASTIATWVLIAVISAVGNAGVPMGCYFLTLSLMSGINMPIGVLGVILPVYAVIDMIETAVNVWSDSCVCAIVDRNMQKK